MRGKATTTCPTNCPGGITPAYAGKRPCPDRGRPAGWDHPRVCGEKKDNPDEWNEVQGSPPRMRGKGQDLRTLPRATRITPAYAGKSHWLFGTFSSERDHPRVCGEKPLSGNQQPGEGGSPPRMRGKADERFFVFCHHGITPAYAGKRRHRL